MPQTPKIKELHQLKKWPVLVLVLMMALGPFSFSPENFFLPKIKVQKAQAV